MDKHLVSIVTDFRTLSNATDHAGSPYLFNFCSIARLAAMTSKGVAGGGVVMVMVLAGTKR
jgi:hypothetical protein